jgi:hypothetical protein
MVRFSDVAVSQTCIADASTEMDVGSVLYKQYTHGVTGILNTDAEMNAGTVL